MKQSHTNDVALKVFSQCPNVKSKRCIDPTDSNGFMDTKAFI